MSKAADETNSSERGGPALLMGDRPIEALDDDLLDRSGLVSAVCETIRRGPPEGFVIGLAGAWGEGKSSVLNLVANQCEKDSVAQVVRFNPWLFADTDDLVERFFSEFASGVRIPGDKAANRLARALSKYGSAAAPLTVVPALGIPVEASRRIAEGGARLLEAGTSLHKHREELKRVLLKAKTRILVVIDDLDRLHSPREVAEMVRLIKLVGDLPNVTYLVAYDRVTVAKALGDGDEQRGLAYLEKIVQAVFEVPPPRRDRLQFVIEQTIRQVVSETDSVLPRHRMATMQIAGVYRLFRNLRDVRRFAIGLPAVLLGVHDEVDVADVIAMEALRLREPRAFAWIMDQARYLTAHYADPIDAMQQQRSDGPKQATALLGTADQPEVVKALVRELFPACAKDFGGTTYDAASFQGAWRRERRVAHYQVLLTYLGRSLPSGTLPSAFVAQGIALFDDEAGLRDFMSALSPPAFRQLLERFADYEAAFGTDQPQIAITELIASSYRVFPEPVSGLQSDPRSALWAVVLRLLRGQRTRQAIEEAVERTRFPNLSAEIYLIALLTSSQTAQGMVSDEWAAQRKARLTNLVLSSSAPSLAREPHLGELLWQADQIEHPRTLDQINNWVADPQFLVRWLTTSMLEKTGANGLVRLLPWAQLTEIVAPKRLTQLIGEIDGSCIDATSDPVALEAFRQAQHYVLHPQDSERDIENFKGFGSPLITQ